MQVLLVAATEKEAEKLERTFMKQHGSSVVDFLFTGVGMVATTYSLTKKISKKKYDLAVNIGLAGSFRDEIGIGEVVNVVTDQFGDLGAEDGDEFLSLSQMGFMDKDHFPFWNGKLKSEEAQKHVHLRSLKQVKAITVNKVHGNEISIRNTVNKFHADIESMEGAAFYYVCMMEKIPCIQVRAISNRVERRNREAWNIELALNNLDGVVSAFIHELIKT
ncbi:MAG: futalosine hydrolase [Bacteroidetes bacterium]|nr:futalosine hydrolase [Bacteroidota bacterium]